MAEWLRMAAPQPMAASLRLALAIRAIVFPAPFLAPIRPMGARVAPVPAGRGYASIGHVRPRVSPEKRSPPATAATPVNAPRSARGAARWSLVRSATQAPRRRRERVRPSRAVLAPGTPARPTNIAPIGPVSTAARPMRKAPAKCDHRPATPIGIRSAGAIRRHTATRALRLRQAPASSRWERATTRASDRG